MIRSTGKHAVYTRFVALVLVVVAALVSTIGSGGKNSEGEYGPPAEARVVSATDLGVLETNSLITARDGGYSAIFAGRSVWR